MLWLKTTDYSFSGYEIYGNNSFFTNSPKTIVYDNLLIQGGYLVDL